MQYLITFLEGLLSFLSPCMLPLLPVYVFYFAGGETDLSGGEAGAEKQRASRGRILFRALAFVLGFTLLFCLMGLFAGTLGTFLARHQKAVNLAAGILVILFGLSYLEVVHLPFFRSGMAAPAPKKKKGKDGAAKLSNWAAAGSAFLFGLVYAVSLTPCVGAFLGSALLLASSAGTALQGFLLLLVYSLGLGIPFLLSALLLEELKEAFLFIKKNYKSINRFCGAFLILVGAAMALGIFGKLMALFG